MTSSFFSAMRLIVTMLTADGKVTSAERAWYRKLCNSFELSKEHALESQYFALVEARIQGEIGLEDLRWAQFEKASKRYAETARYSVSVFHGMPSFLSIVTLFEYFPEDWIWLSLLVFFIFLAAFIFWK